MTPEADGGSDAPPTLAADESGLLSLASLFAIVGLMVGFALVANVGKAVGTKLESQNAADAAAYAASVELARGMNAVTAANHLIGELQAFVVLHHSLGGDELDEGKSAPKTPADIAEPLTITYELAKAFSSGSCPAPIGYDQVKKDCKAGGAIRDSCLELKKIMTWAYVVHAAGAILTQLKPIPIVGWIIAAVGEGVVIAAMAFEVKDLQEWVTLEAVELLARVTLPVKKTVEYAVIPGLYLYTCAVAGAVPSVPSPLPIPGMAAKKAEDAATELAKKHACEANLFPGLSRSPSLPLLALPLVAEPKTLKHPERSQLVRASTPWVQRWRRPWMKFGEEALLMCRFKCFYKSWTDKETLARAKHAKEKGLPPINLLVIRELDLDGDDKTAEPWAKEHGSGKADRHFATVAFARRPPTGIAALGPYRQPNPDGFVTYAQGFVYNANPQEPGSDKPGWQKVAGWDTLNWDNRVPEYPGPSPKGEKCPIPDVPEPRIKINWRAKLVPTTRLVEATLWQQGEVRDVMWRVPSFLPGLVNTH